MQKERFIKENILKKLERVLIEEEKSKETQAKYMREARAFAEFIGENAPVTQTKLVEYKHSLNKYTVNYETNGGSTVPVFVPCLFAFVFTLLLNSFLRACTIRFYVIKLFVIEE